jgi:hypothetical protein
MEGLIKNDIKNNRRWWDVRRSHGEASMQSLWDTKKFRVLAHPCDRDYQHLQGMKGCAPSFSLNADRRSILGYVDTTNGLRIDVDPDKAKGTYAQTMDRNHFTSVGLGRPPFDTSTSSAYRGPGFMSETSIFNEDRTVFESCRNIEQCFVDMFTYNGKNVKRKVLDPATKEMRYWKGEDGQNCGIFGIWIEKFESSVAICPGLDTNIHYCCYMDPAVVPLFYMFHYHQEDTLKPLSDICNSDSVFKIFSPGEIKTHLNNIGATYSTPKADKESRNLKLTGIKKRLNQIMDEFTPGISASSNSAPGTSAHYIKVMDCSTALYDTLQRHTSCPEGSAVDSSPFCTDYSMSEKRMSLHYFLDYTMAEVPFAWWHKCMLLQGRTFAKVKTCSSSCFHNLAFDSSLLSRNYSYLPTHQTRRRDS